MATESAGRISKELRIGSRKRIVGGSDRPVIDIPNAWSSESSRSPRACGPKCPARAGMSGELGCTWICVAVANPQGRRTRTRRDEEIDRARNRSKTNSTLPAPWESRADRSLQGEDSDTPAGPKIC